MPFWPAETLDAFGNLALFDEACAMSSTDSAKWAGFEAIYRSVMAREREALWCATAFDPRFMKGLAIANPALARRVESGSATRGEDKRSRRLKQHFIASSLAVLVEPSRLELGPAQALCILAKRPNSTANRRHA